MIQRIQTIWLLLAAVCSFLIMKFPYFGGTLNTVNTDLNAAHSFLTLILTSAIGAGALIIIFLFKNRKRQLLFTLLALVISLVDIALMHYATKDFSYGHFTVYAAFVLAIPILLILAARAIYKDEKLVKSVDRLR